MRSIMATWRLTPTRRAPSKCAGMTWRCAAVAQRPFCDRHIRVLATIGRCTAVFVVRDEGRGFDPNRLPDPTSEANLGALLRTRRVPDAKPDGSSDLQRDR